MNRSDLHEYKSIKEKLFVSMLLIWQCRHEASGSDSDDITQAQAETSSRPAGGKGRPAEPALSGRTAWCWQAHHIYEDESSF